jgi:hypothetical protein
MRWLPAGGQRRIVDEDVETSERAYLMGQTQASGNTASADSRRRLFRMSCATYSVFDSGSQRPGEERRHSRHVPPWDARVMSSPYTTPAGPVNIAHEPGLAFHHP